MANKLRPGLPVHVHFTALQRVDTPTVTAMLTTVSADQLLDEQTHRPYFSAKIEIAADTVAAERRSAGAPRHARRCHGSDGGEDADELPDETLA